MSEIKWIKITTNMFDDEKIKLIDAMPERDTIFYIWIRLLVQAGKTNAGGYIFLSEDVPYNDEMFSTIFNRPLNSVRLALDTLKSFGMIQKSENNDLKITNWEKHQNVDGMEKIREQTRKRVAKCRAKKKLPVPSNKENNTSNNSSNDTVTLPNAIEVEVDIEEDNTTTATENEPVDNFIDFFNSNMGHLITPFELQTLQSYIEDGMSPEVITLALQEAVEKDAREISYIKAILSRWLEHGLKTVEAVMADKRSFEDKKKNKETKKQQFKNKKDSTFNNFKQRKYDFKDLENKLLGWDQEAK